MFGFPSLICNRTSSRNTYKCLSEMIFLRTQIKKEQIIFIAHIQHSQQQLIKSSLLKSSQLKRDLTV